VAVDDASSGAESRAEDGGRYLGRIQMIARRKKSSARDHQCDDLHNSLCKRENEVTAADRHVPKRRLDRA